LNLTIRQIWVVYLIHRLPSNGSFRELRRIITGTKTHDIGVWIWQISIRLEFLRSLEVDNFWIIQMILINHNLTLVLSLIRKRHLQMIYTLEPFFALTFHSRNLFLIFRTKGRFWTFNVLFHI
jgi:hypothetical protein